MKRKNKLIILGLAIVLAIAGLVLAQTQGELEQELAGLEQDLVDAGYSWLVGYDGSISPRIEVYEQDGSEVVASFDLLVLGGEIAQKKKRIDEIRRLLNG